MASIAAGRPAATLSRDPREFAPHVKAWRVWEDTMLVVQLDRVERDAGRRALEALVRARDVSHLKIVAVVSPDVDLDDDVDTLWGIFTRFDPARDLMFTEASLQGVQPVYSGVMGIDATWKPGYPDAVEMDPDTVRRVDARWKEYWA